MRLSKSLAKKAFRLWGREMQEKILVEECAELTKAIIKRFRDDTPQAMVDIVDEIVDVEIMLEQLEIIYPRCLRDMHKKDKIKRLRERVRAADRTVRR